MSSQPSKDWGSIAICDKYIAIYENIEFIKQADLPYKSIDSVYAFIFGKKLKFKNLLI